MADRITIIQIPGSAKSEEWISVTVTYDAHGKGDLRIDTDSDAFALDCKPSPVVLTAALQGQKSFELKVTRKSGPPPERCRITFTFGNDVVKLLEVT